jgi:hypothetical protein
MRRIGRTQTTRFRPPPQGAPRSSAPAARRGCPAKQHRTDQIDEPRTPPRTDRWQEMNETCDQCGPASAPGTGSTRLASCTCAGRARLGTGGRCPLKAGPSGRWACTPSHRRPAPQHPAARSGTRRSRRRRRRRGPPRTGRPIMPSARGRQRDRCRRARGNGMALYWDAVSPGQAPRRGIRDRGLIGPPAAQPSPVATTRAPGGP